MASIQPAQPHHFAAIATLNVEAYREYESYGFCKDCKLPQRLGLRYWRCRFDLTAIAATVIALNL